MNLSELEQQNKFKKHLSEYWASKGITQIKIPQIGGQELNLFKLYKTVCKKGGGQSVSHNKLWKQIVDEFGLPSTCTSASFTLKNHYQKYLLGYEQRFFFGKDDSADLPELVAGRQRKPMKNQGYNQMNISNRYNSMRHEGDPMQSSLSSELKKYYEKNDPNQNVCFFKRTKIYPVMPEVKHMMMAFQSNIREEIIYALNILTLFSVNTETPFLLSQYPFVIDSITCFLVNHYPPKDLFDLECIRSLTLALRNLLVNHKNLQSILESDAVEILLKIFEEKMDRETTLYVSGIFSSLTRVGLDCKELFNLVQEYLDKDSYEDLETGIDLLRSLVEQKEEECESIIENKIDFFSRLLIYSSMEIREAILEIFAFISDKSEKIKKICLGNLKFMERLFALLSHGYGVNEKQAQLACYILNNISQMHSPESIEIFQKFEKSLMLVSFNDESLSPITSSILFALSGRKNQNEEADKDKENLAMANMRMNIQRNQMEDSNSNAESSDYEEQ